jgi:Inhibitor of vertebrate lysozyme (Ivy)
MNIARCFLRGVAIAAFAVGTPVMALDFGPESVKLYGGDYSPDCNNPSAGRARVAADVLAVERGGKRIIGRNLQDAVSYFGPEPPPDYLTTLLSEVPGGEQLLFIVYRDRTGQYILLAGEPKVETTLGQMLGKTMKSKFRDCNPELHKVSAPAPVQAAPVAGVFDPVRDRKFRSLYDKVLGAKLKVDWLADLTGPMPEVREVNVAGTSYKLIGVCKPHDCYDNSMVVLYSDAKRVVYGRIYESGRITLIGGPPPTLAAELERLWQEQWRKQ